MSKVEGHIARRPLEQWRIENAQENGLPTKSGEAELLATIRIAGRLGNCWTTSDRTYIRTSLTEPRTSKRVEESVSRRAWNIQREGFDFLERL